MTDTNQNPRQPEAPSLKENDVARLAAKWLDRAHDDKWNGHIRNTYRQCAADLTAVLNDQVEGQGLAAEREAGARAERSRINQLAEELDTFTVYHNAPDDIFGQSMPEYVRLECSSLDIEATDTMDAHSLDADDLVSALESAAKALANPPSPQSHGEKR